MKRLIKEPSNPEIAGFGESNMSSTSAFSLLISGLAGEIAAVGENELHEQCRYMYIQNFYADKANLCHPEKILAGISGTMNNSMQQVIMVKCTANYPGADVLVKIATSVQGSEDSALYQFQPLSFTILVKPKHVFTGFP